MVAFIASRAPRTAYLGLSPGLDFESKIFAKVNAPELLRHELATSVLRAWTDCAWRQYRCLPAVRARTTVDAARAGSAA